MQEKKVKMENKIVEIEEGFFKHVATGGDDLDTIKARGELSQE